MPVTRREIDMLRAASDDEYDRIWRAIKMTDDRTDARFKAHRKVHEQETASLLSSHRFRVMAAIGAAASIAAVLGLLIDLLAKVH